MTSEIRFEFHNCPGTRETSEIPFYEGKEEVEDQRYLQGTEHHRIEVRDEDRNALQKGHIKTEYR